MPTASLVRLLGLFSVLMFFGSLIAIPLLITRLPADYFIRHRQLVNERRRRHPVLIYSLLLLRNLAGLIFLLAGMAMLVLPGQGILTLLIGLSLMNFPGKHDKIEWLARRSRVRKSLNWIRRRADKPPFRFE